MESDARLIGFVSVAGKSVIRSPPVTRSGVSSRSWSGINASYSSREEELCRTSL
jgi:hypothetical protein